MGTCPSKPGKLNGSNVDNFVMTDQGTPAKPKNVDSQPKENENPKPVQNGTTMVGGKRKHRKTQRKSKKRCSSRK